MAISSIDSVLNRIETTTKQMENNLNVNILNGVANNDENEKNDKQIKTLEILNQEPNFYQKIYCLRWWATKDFIGFWSWA